jgi:putative FmdB family regulatory protein
VPTYEYACSSCGTHVDVYQRFSDEALTDCGVCGGTLRKVFHPAGILFKGSGFYATDSRSGSRKGSSDGGERRETAGASGDRGATAATPAKGSGSERGSGSKDGSGSGSGGSGSKGESGGSESGGSESKAATAAREGPAKTARERSA